MPHWKFISNIANKGILAGMVGVLLFFASTSLAQPPQVKIQNPQEGYPTGRMGSSVSVDGDTMIVGAPHTTQSELYDIGTALIYRADGLGGWTLEAELSAPDPKNMDYFGISVAISGDTAFIGAYRDDDMGKDSGSVYVFTRLEGVWTQQGKLTASDADGGDLFGRTVAISGDTAIIGAYGNDDSGSLSGSAYVFTRSSGIWKEEAKLIASDAAYEDFFGRSVALSGDTAIIGAQRDDDVGFNSGSAYVFTRSGGVWSQQAKLTAFDGQAGDWFGASVGISGDTAIIGGGQDDNVEDYAGAAYVFTRSGGVWIQQAKLTASDPAERDYFGYSVGLSGDTAIVGAYSDDDDWEDSGSAYVFNRSRGVWTEQDKLTASDASESDFFGSAVGVSRDTAVVGAPADNDGGHAFGDPSGSAYAFKLLDEVWTEEAKLVVKGTAASNYFGESVAVLGDTAIVGASGDGDGGGFSGAVYILVDSGGTWTQQSKLTASDAGACDFFGSAVALSNNTVVVGAYQHDQGENENVGTAYIFTRSGGTWSEEAKLTPSDSTAYDFFGVAVAISGDTAIVGAYKNRISSGSGSGSAYVFQRSGGVWSQEAILTAPDPASQDYFGRSVAISGDTALIGAYRDDDNGEDSGAAYIFQRSNGMWIQLAKLTASDAESEDAFGESVALYEDTAILGALGDDDGRGAAYIFTCSEGVWTEEGKLTASDASTWEYFGGTVSLSRGTAVIGASRVYIEGIASGAAYVFTRSGGVWTERAKLTAADPAIDDFFGSPVSTDGRQVLVGAPGKDDPETDSGSAYVFTLDFLIPANFNGMFAH